MHYQTLQTVSVCYNGVFFSFLNLQYFFFFSVYRMCTEGVVLTLLAPIVRMGTNPDKAFIKIYITQ